MQLAVARVVREQKQPLMQRKRQLAEALRR
jgi:hypothetical protein